MTTEAKKLADYLKPGDKEDSSLPPRCTRCQTEFYSNLCEYSLSDLSFASENELSGATIAGTLAMWGCLSTNNELADPPTNFGCISSITELPVHRYLYCFLSAKKKNPDIFSYNDVVNEPDPVRRQMWLESADTEVQALEGKMCGQKYSKRKPTVSE